MKKNKNINCASGTGAIHWLRVTDGCMGTFKQVKTTSFGGASAQAVGKQDLDILSYAHFNLHTDPWNLTVTYIKDGQPSPKLFSSHRNSGAVTATVASNGSCSRHWRGVVLPPGRGNGSKNGPQVCAGDLTRET